MKHLLREWWEIWYIHYVWRFSEDEWSGITWNLPTFDVCSSNQISFRCYWTDEKILLIYIILLKVFFFLRCWGFNWVKTSLSFVGKVIYDLKSCLDCRNVACMWSIRRCLKFISLFLGLKSPFNKSCSCYCVTWITTLICWFWFSQWSLYIKMSLLKTFSLSEMKQLL